MLWFHELVIANKKVNKPYINLTNKFPSSIRFQEVRLPPHVSPRGECMTCTLLYNHAHKACWCSGRIEVSGSKVMSSNPHLDIGLSLSKLTRQVVTHIGYILMHHDMCKYCVTY